MKKLLLGSVLIGLSGPAMTGPLLENMLPEGSSWTAASQDVGADAETYDGLEVTFEQGRSAHIESLEITQEGDLLAIRSEAGELRGAGGTRAGFGSLSMTTTPEIKDLAEVFFSTPGLSGAPLSPEDACTKLDQPLTLSMADVSLEDDNESRLTAVQLDLVQKAEKTQTSCLVDMSVDLAGLVVSDGTIVTKVEGISAGSYAALSPPETVELDPAPYTSRFKMSGLTMSADGQDQLRIAHVEGTSSTEAESLAALARTGYFDLVKKVAEAGGPGGLAGLDRDAYSIPAVWNAMRAVTSQGQFSIDDLEITGDQLQAVGGTALLAKGNRLDAGIEIDKTGKAIDLTISLDSPNLVAFHGKLGLVMDPLDDSLAEMGPSALMVTMPISLAGAELSFTDDGLGQTVTREMGIDPYMMAEAGIAGTLGPSKAKLVADWLAGATEGGATFAIDPSVPVPAVSLLTGVMGDWSSFGKTLGASSGKL